MSIAERLVQCLAEQHPDQSPYEKGIELRLPESITAVKIKSGELDNTTSMSVQSLLEQLGNPYPHLILLYKQDDEWYFIPLAWMYGSIHFPLGDWWPVFLDAAIRAWIKAIPTTYAGLDLTELIQLTEKCGWGMIAVDNLSADCNETERPVVGWLRSCTTTESWHCGIDEVRFGNQGYSWKPRDPRWLDVIRALEERRKNLKVKMPDLAPR